MSSQYIVEESNESGSIRSHKSLVDLGFTKINLVGDLYAYLEPEDAPHSTHNGWIEIDFGSMESITNMQSLKDYHHEGILQEMINYKKSKVHHSE